MTFERWEHGWELSLEGVSEVGTQSATLSAARQQVRDYLDTVAPGVDHSGWAVIQQPADQVLAERVAASRTAVQDAEVAPERAAPESRSLAAHLSSARCTGTNIAAILGVTRARGLTQESAEH